MDYKTLSGDFNAHGGNDAGVWHSAIAQHGDADVNDSGRLLQQLCCSNALCIMNTFSNTNICTSKRAAGIRYINDDSFISP